MQQGDFTSYHQHNHFGHNPNTNPNRNLPPTQFHQPSYASAPPFTFDYSVYPPNYPPYSQAPSYDPPPSAATTPAPWTLTSQSSFDQQLFAPQSEAASSAFLPYDSHVPYQPPYNQTYDQHQTAPSYGLPPANSNPNPNPTYYSASYTQVGSSVSSAPPAYHITYDTSMNFDNSGSSYLNDKYRRGYNRSGFDLHGRRADSYSGYGDDGGHDDGVYAYEGGKVEPYGARGTAPKPSTWVQFDDYGRSINFPSGEDSSGGKIPPSASSTVTRAVPKAETQQDVQSGANKFRVKYLSEGGGHAPMDVLFRIGLDGIQMLDPTTSRVLRVYSPEDITRCEVMDSTTFAFWSKSSVDIEPRRIRLQSNSYTTNTLLDIVTAATLQIKAMGVRNQSPESLKTTEQPAENKRGFGYWMNLIKPGIEEKHHWVPDEAVSKCNGCGTDFGAFVRKHHCRNCGDIFCDTCTLGRVALTANENAQRVRICDQCMAEGTKRLSNAKKAASKFCVLRSHEDRAEKLQEEMEKNRRPSSGSKSDGSSSGGRMKEVACPTCTVHLQVQVPSSGSETIECGVCQHPFLVTAH